MSSNSNIEWTEATWNPLSGCKEVSPGCTNCYAAKMAKRLEAMGQAKYAGTTRTLDNGKVVWTGKINLDEAALQIPLRKRKPTTYFVNSMSDLFHEDVPDEFIDKVFAAMALCPQHTFQVLTKRAERMSRYLRWDGHNDDCAQRNESCDCRQCCIVRASAGSLVSVGLPEFDAHAGPAFYLWKNWPLPNVWLGVSCEDQQRADERIPHLLRTPAAVRWLSCEPLLGQISLKDIKANNGSHDYLIDCLNGLHGVSRGAAVDWIVVGGESGHGARPMNPAWVRSLRDQCVAAGVAYFFKQWGEFAPCDPMHEFADKAIVVKTGPRESIVSHGGLAKHVMIRVGKKAAGRLLDGREWNEYPAQRGT